MLPSAFEEKSRPFNSLASLSSSLFSAELEKNIAFSAAGVVIDVSSLFCDKLVCLLHFRFFKRH